MGWLNESVAAIWGTGAAMRRILSQRRSAPERNPGEHSWYLPLPRQTGGVRVTPDTALQVSAVWACVSVISKDIAASTWQVFRVRPDGDRDLARDHRVFRMLNVQPNPEMTAFAFREALLVSALLWGDGFAEIERSDGGLPLALWPIHPDRVTLRRNASDDLEYEIANPVSDPVVIPARNMLHIHGPGVEGLVGFDVIRLASVLFGHTLAADLFGAAFYGNGAHAGQVIETAYAPKDKEAFEEFRQSIRNQVSGPERELGLLILTHGTAYKPMSIEPEKAQFIETRQHLIEEIARWFDVPPHKIGHLLRASFNNIEEQGKDYVNKIIPWCERCRQEVERKLVRSPNIVTRIEVEWLAEGNAKDKAEADSTLVNNGIQSRNEVRRRRGLNSLGVVGDKLTVQQAMTTLERIGEEPTEPPPGDGIDTGDEESSPEAGLRTIEGGRHAAD